MKKGIIIVGILLAIVLVVGAYFITKDMYSNKNGENKVTNTSTNSNSPNTTKENKVTNTTTNKNNTVNNTTNTVVDNSIGNTTTNEISTETFEDNPQTEEQKAISIVKKDWGANDVSVKIAVEGINENGAYRVTVRDSSTTELKASYKVDVKTGTFDKKEIM